MDPVRLYVLGSDTIRSEHRTRSTSRELPPDRKAHLDNLIAGFAFTRWFILTYQAAVVVVVLLVVLWRWAKIWRPARRRRHVKAGENEVGDGKDTLCQRSVDRDRSSSSRSTLDANTTPTVAHQVETSNERSPLLFRKTIHRTHAGPFRVLHSWLLYQPPPIPFINKTLPPNTATISILALTALQIFYLSFAISPSSSTSITILSDRASALFIANLPWLYLLSAKNCPFKQLTGYSYESLNILHRRLGEWMCFLAVVHFGGMLWAWYDLLRPTLSLWAFVTIRYILWGTGAWVAYEGLYVLSLGSVREWWYEMFLGSHVLLQAAGLGMLWLHHFRARPYVGVALGIFVLDRVVWRLGVKRWEVQADLEVMEDGETVRVSADWKVRSRDGSLWRKLLGYDMQYGWLPSQHVFITIPAMGRSYALQAHPMTIASAAPALKQDQTHAWFNLIIRAKDGFSRDLAHYANAHSSALVKLDGPYGSTHAEEMLCESDLAVVVAGGSGIAVAYPILWDLLHRERSSCQQVCLIWIVQEASHIEWIGMERLEDLKELGLEVVIPGPSRKAGRPDVKVSVREKIAENDGSVGVVVSGPDGLNRDVRNVCAEMVRAGRDVDVAVEKFGW